MDNSNDNYYNTLYRLWSVIALGAGTRLLWELTAQTGSAEELYMSLKDGNGPAGAVRAAKDIPLEIAEKMLDSCASRGINVIAKEDDIYPERLRSIGTAPPVLFVKGDISGIDERLGIAVVGARKPSDYSRKVTAGLVSTLSRHGFDIISGFAEGIDICAHLTAVKYGARTYAVLGCGIDTIYPKPNEKYKDLIIANGAMISEFLPSASPYPTNFPCRNRIIAALSAGVAVIEAGGKSGSLNTASHGAEQGKTVFAVTPADLFDSRYRGNVDLIRKGALPLMGARDIYNEYCLNLPHTIVENDAIREQLSTLREIKEAAESSEAEKKAPPEKEAHEPEPAKKQMPHSGDPLKNAIIKALWENTSALRADEIARDCDTDIGEILTALTDMEIEGIVMSENGAYTLGQIN